jgi:diguanylate cyclase (GGDEF)-like protein
VWLLVAALTALAAFLWTDVIHGLPQAAVGPVGVPWWAFAIFFYVAEAYVVHLHFRSEAHTLSLSEFGLVVGLFCTSPQGLVLAQLCGATVALIVRRRQRPLKAAFNVSLFALCSSLAIVIFHALGHTTEPYAKASLEAAFAAVAVAGLVGVLLVALAISLSEGKPVVRALPFTAALALGGAVASASLALATIELLRLSPWLIVLEILPAGCCALAFLAYVSQRRRHEHLGFLYESMRATQAARDFDSVAREFLLAARRMLRADVAELLLFPASDSDQALRSILAPGLERSMQPTPLSAAERMALETVSQQSSPVLLPRGRAPHALDGYLGERGLKDGLLIALRAETGVFGLLLVGDRAGDVATFDRDDCRLFETFAGHASVLLENDRLEQSHAALVELQEQLRHQAFHDALTGLPNRVLFADRVGEALARAATGESQPAVLFLDLDDFKTINDSLGHAAGDELLAGVAERVRASVRPVDVPARLGGDEFAVLIEDAADCDPEGVAERLVEALATPIALHGREVTISGTVGIAVADTNTESADELLRNADLAMYGAKAKGKRGYAVYQPQMRARVRMRHELGAALGRALEQDEISVHYQPIVEIEDGRTVALEALARWEHPRRGLVPPSAFIPLAEETGLMIPLGRAILAEACRRTQAWRALPQHAQLSVSVNLSPVELQDPRLVDEVAGILATTGLDPAALILEITENGAMRDAEATVRKMHDLRELGVRLALDDFGTGHSSLSHLREFPVDLLKIAKPFVDRLREVPPDPTFIEAILGLARSLGLKTVAEGIEHRSQANELRALQCVLGQGFHFARPLDAVALAEHLRASLLRAPSPAPLRKAS